MSWVSAVWDWHTKPENRAAVKSLLPFYGSVLTFVGSLIVGVGTVLVGGLVAWAALRQARIARQRHEAQTRADRAERITDAFSTAVGQLGSDKMEVRVGGIYTLELLASEALTAPQADDATGNESTALVSDLYWTVMETLTAFVRERARWQGSKAAAVEMVGKSDYLWGADTRSDDAAPRPAPPTDIAAVLTVLRRRPAIGRTRETEQGWILDLRATDLRGADLNKAHLEGAILTEAHLERAHLEGAILTEAHLEGADLIGATLTEAHLERARLEGAILTEARLQGANLDGAHLEGAILTEAHLERAHLEGAILTEAHLEGATFRDARLERAFLRDAHLEGAILTEAHLERARLEGAFFGGAHLEGAYLVEAHLEGANLDGAHLEGAFVRDAYLEGADLNDAHLEGADLVGAIGDARTRLPEGFPRPPGWPAYAPD